MRRSPLSRCPSPCRPAQKNPRPRPSVPARLPESARERARTTERGAAEERIDRDARAKSPNTPPATHVRTLFANKSPLRRRAPVPPTRAGQGPVPDHDAGGSPAAGPGARTSGHAGKGPSATQEAEPSLRDRRARSWRRWSSSSSNASASCGRGRSAPVPGRHRRLTTVPFGDHCKRGGRAEPLARDRIPAGAGSARVSARQALIPTGRDEHDGKEKQRQGRARETAGRRTKNTGTEDGEAPRVRGAPLGRGREGSADGVQRDSRRSGE